MTGKRHSPPQKFYGSKQPEGIRTSETSTAVVKIDDKGIAVNLWALPLPTVEYHADNCGFEVISGAPTVYFYQVGPGGKFLNAIALSFTRMAFEKMNESLQTIRGSIEEGIAKVYASDSIVPLHLTDQSITYENFRKFSVQIIRAASSVDSAYIDFYNLPPPVEQQGMTRSVVESSIQPRIRVFLTPVLLLYLLNIIDAKENVHGGQ